MTTCIQCQHATTRSPMRAFAQYFRNMWRMGFVGCALKTDSATVIDKDREWDCVKWVKATAEQMARRA